MTIAYLYLCNHDGCMRIYQRHKKPEEKTFEFLIVFTLYVMDNAKNKTNPNFYQKVKLTVTIFSGLGYCERPV